MSCQHRRTDAPKPGDCCSEGDLCRRTCQKGAGEDRRSGRRRRRKKWVSIPCSSDMYDHRGPEQGEDPPPRRAHPPAVQSRSPQLSFLRLCPAPCQLSRGSRGGCFPPRPSLPAARPVPEPRGGRITAWSTERCRRPSCWCRSRTCNSLKPLSVLSPGIPQCRGSRGENQK